MSSSGSALLTFAMLLGPASSAWADPASDARDKFQHGVQLFREHRYTEAREAFEEAYRILPNGRVLANIAASFVGEGRPAEAIATYRRFLSEGNEGQSATAREVARREIARLRASIGDVALAIEPAGAEIIVDGRAVGVAPLAWPLALTPGQSTLEVRAPGFVPFARTIEIEQGGSISLSVVLQPIRAGGTGGEEAPAASQGQPRPEPPPAGRAEPAPSPPAAPPPSEPTPVGRGPLLWTGVGLTAALAVAATVTGVLTLDQKAEYEDALTSRERRRELYDSTPRLATATDVLLDAAVLTAVLTTALFIFGGPSDDGAGRPGELSLSLDGAPCGGVCGSF
jgi:hypothetical protein